MCRGDGGGVPGLLLGGVQGLGGMSHQGLRVITDVHRGGAHSGVGGCPKMVSIESRKRLHYNLTSFHG